MAMANSHIHYAVLVVVFCFTAIIDGVEVGEVRTCLDKKGAFQDVGLNVTVSYQPTTIQSNTSYKIKAGIEHKGTFKSGVLHLVVALWKEKDNPFINVTQNATCQDILSLFADDKGGKIHGYKIECPFDSRLPTAMYPYLQVPSFTSPDRDHFYFPEGDYYFKVRLEQMDGSPYFCIEGRVNVLNSDIKFPDFDSLDTDNTG